MTCPDCGVTLAIGMHPFCPHGVGFANVNGDECDYVDENLGPEPIRIRSWSERARLMKERGLIEKCKWAGPGDQHATRWDAPPAYVTAEGEARRLAHWYATEADAHQR